ncbi:TetR/AcrR family transcriptional regulator [bacterium]|nr:TetR/AcrR family transcriptional regulator [bacterium]MBU1637789.1 TetR/AcrR family transcriptional regulator [bacterium]
MIELSKDERVRQQILKAALEVFAKWGLFKTTMEEIAKAAGKGKSTLYYYFKSKDEIFFDLAIQEFGAIFAKAQAAIAQETTAESKLRAYVLCMIEEIQQRTTVYQVVFADLPSFETIMTRLRKEFDAKEQDVISRILKEGVDSGELQPFSQQEISDLSHLMLVSFKAYLFEHVTKGNMDGARKMFKLAISVSMRGLKK